MRKIFIIGFLLFSSSCFMVLAQADTSNVRVINMENFDVNVATQQYIVMLSPEQKAKSDAYFEGGYWILLWGFVIDLLTAWIFLSLGLSKWIKRIASKAKKINIRNLFYILLYLFLALLISFPFSVYTGFIREQSFGLSNMTFLQWFSEDIM